jgi:hypothetical protein
MWTADALASEATPYRQDIWRVVESQYIASTMRITDSLEEQAILEEVLEESKPVMPPACAGLDYLLATPFRYRPYPFGSRFRRAGQEEGAFYASERVETAIAETAYYRGKFFDESPQTTLPANAVEMTAFKVPCRTQKHVDLTEAPFARDKARWTDPSDYSACQGLADLAREAGIAAIRYQSVRDPQHQANVVVLSPRAFGAKAPVSRQTWRIFPRPRVVQAWCEAPQMALEFPRGSG